MKNTSRVRILMISFFIIVTYMIIEVLGGIWTNSLALIADAGHMLSDAVSLLISLLAMIIGGKAASKSKSYGYKRIEILAALLNGFTLIAISFYIFYEGFTRFKNPPEVASGGMLLIAFIGLLINILVAWMIYKGGDTKKNINIRSAFLHVISDLLGSVGAILAALLIIFFQWNLADPIISIFVAILILLSGFRVFRDAVHILMEGTPLNINLEGLKKEIYNLEKIEDISDIHLWSITSEIHIFTCKIKVRNGNEYRNNEIIDNIEQLLNSKGVNHVTVQILY